MMRPIMTRAELATHEVRQHGRDYRLSDDGYGDMDVAARQGWTAISGWGLDGWDLGDWPLVVVSVRDVPRSSKRCGECGTITCADTGGYEMRQTIEGDTTAYRFATPEDRNAAIDYLFVWYGLRRGYDDWTVKGLTEDKRDGLDAGALRVPERFRGPFSWARADREAAE